MDSSFLEPAYRELDNPQIQMNAVSPVHDDEDMREHIIQELKIVLQGQQKRDLERFVYYYFTIMIIIFVAAFCNVQHVFFHFCYRKRDPV